MIGTKVGVGRGEGFLWTARPQYILLRSKYLAGDFPRFEQTSINHQPWLILEWFEWFHCDRDFAEEVKSSAEGVAAALEEAAEAQGEADAAIKQANKDIGRAENEITQVGRECSSDNSSLLLEIRQSQGSVFKTDKYCTGYYLTVKKLESEATEMGGMVCGGV